MKKNYIIGGFFGVIFIFFIGILLSQKTQVENILKDSFVKNTGFDTNLEKDVPYVIGNDLEFYYIFDQKLGSIAELNIEKLKETIDISEIKIGDKIISNEDKISVDLDTTTPVKISGKSKVNNNSNETKIDDLIEIEITESQKTEEPENNLGEENGEETTEIITNNPENIILQDSYFSGNIDNILEFSGKNIENIEYINIGGLSFSPKFKNDIGYILIPKDSFASGKYFVLIQPKNGNIFALDEQISFQTVTEEIHIVNITPNRVENNKSSYIVVQGSGFNKVISVQLNNNVVLQKTSFQVINDQVMSIKIPEGLTVGNYSFNFMTTNKIVEMPYISFGVTQ